MAGVLTLLFLLSIALLIWGLLSPAHLSRTARLPKPLARKHVGLACSISAFLLLVLIGLTTPKPTTTTIKQTSDKSSNTSQRVQPTITTKTVTETSSIPFTTKTEDSSSLSKGQTKIIQNGQAGVETTTYLVTLSNGQQTNKVQQSQTVTTPPVEEIIENGTYVAPAPTPTPAPTQSPTPSPAPSQSCYPLTNGGNCYEPGEYCRNSDHGTSGVAGDGESITCEDNNGWRWEPN